MSNTKKSQIEKFNSRYAKNELFEEVDAKVREAKSTKDSTLEGQADNLIKKAGIQGTLPVEEIGAFFSYTAMDALFNWTNKSNKEAMINMEKNINEKLAEMENRLAAKYEALLEQKIQEFTTGVLTGMNRFMSQSMGVDVQEVAVDNTPITPTIEVPPTEEATHSEPQQQDANIPYNHKGIDWKNVGNTEELIIYIIGKAKTLGWEGKTVASFKKLGSEYNASYQKAMSLKLDWNNLVERA